MSGISDTYNNPGSTYTYDENGNQESAIERRGRTRKMQTPYSIFSDYNGYDEPTETRHMQQTDPGFRYTNYTYDPNGNVETRMDDGDAPLAGRKHEYEYDESDQLKRDFDWGPNPLSAADDQQVRFSYFSTGWQQQRAIERWEGSWVLKQTVDSTYFANGDLKTRQTHNGGDPVTLLESHELEYIGGGIYLNGNRTKDTFRLQSPTPTACQTQDCVTSYGYGPRENLTLETTNRPSASQGLTRSYGYDYAMNLNHEDDNGPGGDEWWYTHAGNRLQERRTTPPPDPDPSPDSRRYFYDEWGNLNCVTTGDGSSADCRRPFGAATPLKLVESYEWDYLNRLDHSTHFANGSTSDDADYEHDPLNRVAKETETHSGGLGNRLTCFTYLGVSSDVSQDAWVANVDPCTAAPLTTKAYSYEANGERVGMKKVGGMDSGDYFYVRNVHTDVSLLQNDGPNGGSPKASYVYKPYGAQDDLSTGDPDTANALNAFRFNDMRLDSGSLTIDMGARRYGADVGRFLQRDSFIDAVANRDIDVDASLQNRYIFGAANPVNSIETDGHEFIRLLHGDRGIPPAMYVNVFFMRPSSGKGTNARVFADFRYWSNADGSECGFHHTRCALWNFGVSMTIYQAGYQRPLSREGFGWSRCHTQWEYYARPEDRSYIPPSSPQCTQRSVSIDSRGRIAKAGRPQYADIHYKRSFARLPGSTWRTRLVMNVFFNFNRYLSGNRVKHGKYEGWATPQNRRR